MKDDFNNYICERQVGKGLWRVEVGSKGKTRKRPWQRLGFKSKKQYLIAKKNGDLNELEMLISQKSK